MSTAPHARARSPRQIAFAVDTNRSTAAFVLSPSTAAPTAARANTNTTAGSHATSPTNIFARTVPRVGAREGTRATSLERRALDVARAFFFASSDATRHCAVRDRA
jgi:hypothetical protein